MTAFISYSGDVDLVAHLADTLRRHGLRHWRYQDRVGQGRPTEPQIDEDLARCVSAMVWIGGDTLASDFVLTVELPRIFKLAEGGLRIVPLFVEGTVAEGVEQVHAATGFEISPHSGYRFDEHLTFEENVRRVAARELAEVLRVRAALGHRPTVRMVTRSDGAEARDTADLNIDWIAEYPADGTLPTAAVVGELRDALHVAAQNLISAFGVGPVDLQLKCHLHLAVAVGFEFRRVVGMRPRVFHEDTWLPIEMVPELPGPERLVPVSTPGAVGEHRVAVELCISRDVSPLVTSFAADTNTRYRKRVRLTPPDGPGQMAVTPSVVNAWAEEAAEQIRAAREMPGVSHVDVFMAAPVPFAVALGWRLNAVGGVRLLHPTGNAGPYGPVWDLPDS